MPRRAVTFGIAVAVGALFIAGLFLHGVASFGLLALTDLVLVTLAVTTWPVLRRGDRLMRSVVIAAIAAVAVARLVG
ncbi:MAG TPA: DUF6703 family protein [Mycobacteriales bacterium]|nr:DUF6703 family protein [Mycobacteriales bacterium]